VERLLILSPGKVVGGRDVERILSGGAAADPPGDPGPPRTSGDFADEAERSRIVAKLSELDWNVAETARALRVPRSSLARKIERYRISRESP
jgi:two-component system nitrogen regulation response regulator NtrX